MDESRRQDSEDKVEFVYRLLVFSGVKVWFTRHSLLWILFCHLLHVPGRLKMIQFVEAWNFSLECEFGSDCWFCLQIDFMVGSDGHPWVWVMGEHKDDLPYDEIVRVM